MAFAVQGRIEGVGEVLKALDAVDAKVRKKLTRRAVSKAARMVMWKARALVTQQTGHLRRSLGQKVKVYRKNDAVVAIIGPRTGFKEEVVRDGRKVISNPTRYAHLVERGTRHADARPFLEPAFKTQQAELKNEMASVIAEGLKTK